MSENQNASREQGMGKFFFQASAADFKKISGSPIAYWSSSSLGDAFQLGRKIGESAKKGLSCSGTELFYRNFWEVSIDSCSIKEGVVWYPITKGGPFRKWYGNNDFFINWKDSGSEIKNRVDKNGKPLAVIRNEEFYFRAGASWNDVSSGALSCRYTPEGSIPTDSGPMIYSEEFLMEILSFLNSCVAKPFSEILCPTIHFSVGQVAEFPLVVIPGTDYATRAMKAINIARDDWNASETSWDFTSLPPLLPDHRQPTLNASYQMARAHWCEMTLEMQRLEQENNRIFIDAYGLQSELMPEVPLNEITLTSNPHYRYGSNKSEAELEALLLADTMRELVSYAIGCMMGRYSLDEPGLIYAHAGNVGFDASRYVKFPADADGIVPLTDLPWFPDDAARRITEFLVAVWGEPTRDENLAWLAESLGQKADETPEETIRRYLSASFFKDHCQTYKKRPIYWLFSSGKHKAFEALVYLHRYNESTLARLRAEYVVPLTGKMSERIRLLEDDATKASSTARKKIDKDIDKLRKKLEELRQYDEKLRHYADQRITLDLDDGVKVNYGKFGDLLDGVKAITGGSGDE